jgi:hypothetical protein
MAALEQANEVRMARAQMRRDLRSGWMSVRVVILDPPDYVKTMYVLDLLMAAPSYGRVKASKILRLCRISTGKTVGGLSERQRGELESMLRR